MKRIVYFLPLILLLCTGGCSLLSGESSLEKVMLGNTTGTLAITGTVEYVQLEGGFWAIEGRAADAEKTETYEPLNLPESFEVDGQRVRVRAKVRDDMGSIHMVVPIIEIRSIEPRN